MNTDHLRSAQSPVSLAWISWPPVALGGDVMTFVQIIEMTTTTTTTTTKAPEVEELMNGWMTATEGRRNARRSLLTKDRDRPDT
jgi:hypothetical protein